MGLRVLHCPTNVGNNPQGLARAEREAGLESVCVSFDEPFGYPVDESLATPNPLLFEARRWGLLRRALREFDAVHFNFGRSLFSPPPPVPWRDDPLHAPGRAYVRALALRDLPLLRRAGKTIAVTFQGDDARQGHGSPLAEAVGEGYYTPAGDAVKRRTIAAFDRYADRIFFLNPDLGDVLPARARFLPYASVDPREWRPREPAPLAATPRIVHAPSHRGVKGTEHVVAAVEQLRREGVAVELELVEGVGHAEARRAYERADLLVDQLLVGWYGALAIELMALGRPVVCFVDDETAGRHAPPELLAELPIVRATRDDLGEVLRRLLTERRDEYPELAHRSRAFAERWHDPARIGERMRAEYEAAQAERRS
jgi:glycosyltransferase involved in cell wall biosynthesis